MSSDVNRMVFRRRPKEADNTLHRTDGWDEWMMDECWIGHSHRLEGANCPTATCWIEIDLLRCERDALC